MFKVCQLPKFQAFLVFVVEAHTMKLYSSNEEVQTRRAKVPRNASGPFGNDTEIV